MAANLSAEGNSVTVEKDTDMPDNYVNQTKETLEQTGRVTNEATREVLKRVMVNTGGKLHHPKAG